ncbi:hypothetical protein [Roseibacillus ishigakijimensis]|uniref:Zinc-ribbon domain-containing protein n=1 Tax=Roseibacillus ishigakijimensis TaxID=454146 RepID=A0A934RSB2_9BACT|nr:hypothetical protein [Roseibacillus ishigakijimensis]MBK1833325.1 hypothetical protein [Roseibacillus ishigakijimensis]
MKKETDYYLCPDCGAEVAVGSSGCRACGPRKVAQCMGRKKKQARKKRSWEQDSASDGLDLPGDDDFDYEDYVAREFGGKPHRRVGLAWYWWLTAVLLLVSFFLLVFS